MARSQAEKALTHERIVHVAAKSFREVGLNGIGVADLMKEAGLTGGGFYRHFESRDKLVEESLEFAFSTWRQKVEKEGSALTMAVLVGDYLSEEHRDHPGAGCAVGALVTDVSRSSSGARKLFTKQVKRNVELIEGLVKPHHDGGDRQQAIFAMSALIGALTLSRAVDDPDLSNEILSTVKDQLVST